MSRDPSPNDAFNAVAALVQSRNQRPASKRRTRTTFSAPPDALRELDFLALQHGCDRNHLIGQGIHYILSLAGKSSVIEQDARLLDVIRKSRT